MKQFFVLALFAVCLVFVVSPGPALAEESFELVFPQDPFVTEFSDSWGDARSGHRHQGNDLMAPKMTGVYAVADGVVVWIRDRGTAGRYVVLEHEGGWESWYMHLNDDNPGTDDGAAAMSLGITVAEGEVVEAGQLIGYVGDSGNAEGSSAHTHFELHRNGSPVDPHSYLVSAYDIAIERPPPGAPLGLRIR